MRWRRVGIFQYVQYYFIRNNLPFFKLTGKNRTPASYQLIHFLYTHNLYFTFLLLISYSLFHLSFFKLTGKNGTPVSYQQIYFLYTHNLYFTFLFLISYSLFLISSVLYLSTTPPTPYSIHPNATGFSSECRSHVRLSHKYVIHWALCVLMNLCRTRYCSMDSRNHLKWILKKMVGFAHSLIYHWRNSRSVPPLDFFRRADHEY